MNRIKKVLDSYFKRVIQTKSADWAGNNVWAVNIEGDIVNAVEGIFIYQSDYDEFILMHRTEENEQTETTDIFTYNIDVNSLKELINEAKKYQ